MYKTLPTFKIYKQNYCNKFLQKKIDGTTRSLQVIKGSFENTSKLFFYLKKESEFLQ